MASTYSNLKIQLMATGENSGTWGNVTNTNLGTALEQAITGSADVAVNADTSITLTDSNAAQDARALRLNLSGAGGFNLTVPNIQKLYLVNNGSLGTVTVKNSTGATIAVPTTKTMWVFSTGTGVVDAVTHLTSLTLGSALPIASGGTGSTSTTYANLQTNVTGTLPIANGGTGASTLAGANIPVTNVANSFTGLQTFSGTSSNASHKAVNMLETATVSATAATGTINYDTTTQSVLYYTTNASGNFTVNFRGSSGTSQNTIMATGESMSVTFLVTNGSTAYYNSSVQVDGTTSGVTTKWQGGSAPTTGNASSIDSYTYVIIKTGSATFTVLASQTKFA